MKSKNKKQGGFTLMEILIYIGVLSIIILAISSFLLWSIRSNSKAKAMRETLDNARRAMEEMTYEIREAKSIYLPTSVFDVNPGQLSLETVHYLPDKENTTYIDFYLCDTSLCLKKESQNPIAITSDRVQISNLIFTRVITGGSSSLQIDLTVDYKNPANRPENQTSVHLKTTTSLRSY